MNQLAIDRNELVIGFRDNEELTLTRDDLCISRAGTIAAEQNAPLPISI